MKFLGLSGSLRATSLNSLLLRATSRLVPEGVTMDVYTNIGSLPLFNPDIEATNPAPVAQLRNAMIAADALIIASPEYAHGITGVMKNALDWMVSVEALIDKPVALFNAAPNSLYALPALKEIVTTMSWRIIERANIEVWVRGSRLDEDGLVTHAEISTTIREALVALKGGVRE
jgi:chromate reductase